jgi:mRNA-degrading endonuclease RelE of RelBE toxin-antitoxin system
VKRLAVSHHFQRQLKKLSPSDQEKIRGALKEFLTAIHAGQIPLGFGFKKINGDKYEIRAGLKIRILMKQEGDLLICHVVGNHETIRQYLRKYRNK